MLWCLMLCFGAVVSVPKKSVFVIVHSVKALRQFPKHRLYICSKSKLPGCIAIEVQKSGCILQEARREGVKYSNPNIIIGGESGLYADIRCN